MRDRYLTNGKKACNSNNYFYLILTNKNVRIFIVMPSDEHSESTRSRYDSCDPKYLRDLRLAAGMELEVLARTACLSVAQVRALESDAGGDFFYSHTIRRQAYKRVLMILGAEPPTVDVPESLRDAHQVAEAHLNTLDQIVAMSHQPPMNFTLADRARDMLTGLVAHKQFLGALSLLVAAVALFVLYGPMNGTSSLMTAVATPATTETVVPVAQPAASANVAPAISEAASTPVVVASAPVAMASVPVAVAAKPVLPLSCAYSPDTLPQLSPFVARKEGGYVYVVSAANVELCVVDGNKQATLLQLKAGENRTVSGPAPWQLSSAQLKQLQIYFQGGRVTLPDEAIQRFKLVELPVSR